MSTILVFVASILVITSIVFYKTVVTKEWRNRVPNERDHWHGWIFYYNPDDPRYVLPKRTGLGWTINFAHPGAVAMVIAIMVAVVSFGIMVMAPK